MKPADTHATRPKPTKPKTSLADHDEPIEKRWWNINVPRDQWTADCPEFLDAQSDKNISILSIRDEDHPRLSWAEVQDLIDTNHIDQFHRMPGDLRRYHRYCHDLKQRYGSILEFLQHQRLGWPVINPSGDAPFHNKADYKILYNDWPYAIDRDITHVVVWTKFVLVDDPKTGHLEEKDRFFVEEFIAQTFCHSSTNQAVIDRSDLRWFKNWTSLRSVHALEHFHVMLYKAPSALVDRVTQGDKPMCEQFESC